MHDKANCFELVFSFVNLKNRKTSSIKLDESGIYFLIVLQDLHFSLYSTEFLSFKQHKEKSTMFLLISTIFGEFYFFKVYTLISGSKLVSLYK